jgi:hypothetical protein
MICRTDETMLQVYIFMALRLLSIVTNNMINIEIDEAVKINRYLLTHGSTEKRLMLPVS